MVGGQAIDKIENEGGLELGELEELRESKSGVRFRAGGHGEDVMCGVGQKTQPERRDFSGQPEPLEGANFSGSRERPL